MKSETTPLHASAVSFSPPDSPPSLQTGMEWVIDAYGCCPKLLAEGTVLKTFCELVISELELKVVGSPQWHQFPAPGGWTGMYLLSESHLTCHTFPEHGLFTVNLYCCRPRPVWPWAGQLRQHLQASQVVVRSLSRGDLLSEARTVPGNWVLEERR